MGMKPLSSEIHISVNDCKCLPFLSYCNTGVNSVNFYESNLQDNVAIVFGL